MPELSPETQKIVNAAVDVTGYGKETALLKLRIAAVLRALAKQSTFADTKVCVTEEVVLVDDILKIATELEQ